MVDKLRVAIRADASLLIGTGHIMRCFVIAARLVREYGAEVLFVTREHAGNLIDFIEQKKAFSLAVLPAGEPGNDVREPYNQWLSATEAEDIRQTRSVLEQFNPNWMLFDHYALGEKSHRAVKDVFNIPVAVIDDLAERALCCDLLIDHNCAMNHEERYRNLIPEDCKRFFGPGYMPFRDDLLLAARKQVVNNVYANVQKQLFVFLGGGDTFAVTKLVLDALLQMDRLTEINVDVVVGMSCPHRDQLEALCNSHSSITYHCQTPHLAALMVKADLAIGSGGINSSERVLLRLPTIAFAWTENQKPGLICYDAKGCLHYLGDYSDISATQLKLAIEKVLFDEPALAHMRAACREMIPTPGNQDGLAEICQYMKDYDNENR